MQYVPLIGISSVPERSLVLPDAGKDLLSPVQEVEPVQSDSSGKFKQTVQRFFATPKGSIITSLLLLLLVGVIVVGRRRKNESE